MYDLDDCFPVTWYACLKSWTSIVWESNCIFKFINISTIDLDLEKYSLLKDRVMLDYWISSYCFLWRSPDTSRVRSKMIYASSKDRFKRELDGIQVELQATDPTEMGLDVFKSRVNWWAFWTLEWGVLHTWRFSYLNWSAYRLSHAKLGSSWYQIFGLALSFTFN